MAVEHDSIYIPPRRRDPKPTCDFSWWIGLSRDQLDAEAYRRWPSPTSGEPISGVVYENAAKRGVL